MKERIWICLKCRYAWRQKHAEREPRNCPLCKSQIIIPEGMDRRETVKGG